MTSNADPQTSHCDKPTKGGAKSKNPFASLRLHHIINIFLTIALVSVGALQYCTYQTTNKQNAVINRAFVNSDGIRIEEERQDGTLVGWRYVAMVKNSGNTPTRDATISTSGANGPVRVSTFIAPSYPIGVEPAFIDPEFSYYMPDSIPSTIALGAHASADVARIEISTTQAAGMRQGRPITNLAYLGGVIFYFDQLDPTIRHETKFCYVIGPAGSLVDAARPDYSFCSYWNCTDDECETDKRRYREEMMRAFKARSQTMPECFYGGIPPVPPACRPKPPIPDPSLRYLVEPSLAAAQERSAKQCKAMGCDGKFSVYWWDVRPLNDGTAVVVIQATGPYAVRNTVLGRTDGLSDQEIRSLKTAKQLGRRLPEEGMTTEIPTPNAFKEAKRPWHFP
jgi:hypothetical protein